MDKGVVLAPGVYNALFAKLVEHTGFDAIYVTGFGTAARYGYPDVGLVTQTEMVENLRYICRATNIPVIRSLTRAVARFDARSQPPAGQTSGRDTKAAGTRWPRASAGRRRGHLRRLVTDVVQRFANRGH